ncbi:hypothetical protein EBS02_00270 [bacterium]|nr:hypothetical protein [bacterium]
MGFQFGVKKEEPKKKEEKKEDSPIIPGNESKEDWMTKKWRPMMAMMYMLCCLADFAIFPIMFTIVQFWETQAANDAFRQWVPITLQGGGLFHVAMGAVLGVSAFGRTQEKIAGAAGGPAGGVPTPTLSPNPSPMSSPQMGGYMPPQRSMPSQSYNDPYSSGTVTTSSTTTTAGAPNLARIRQLDPDNVFERG